MTLIADIVSGVPLVQLIKGGKAVVDKILKLDPPERMLWIINEQFGERIGLTRKQIIAWLDVDDLGDAIVGVVHGNLLPQDSTYVEELIVLQLDNVIEAERPEVAGEIAKGMFMLAPWMQATLEEGFAHISHKLDRQHEVVVALGDQTEEDDSGPSSAAEALLRGPLVQVGREKDAHEAGQLAEAGRAAEAAAILESIAGSLKAAGLGPVAETYLSTAAELYVNADDDETASRLLTEAAEDQVARRASSATVTIRKVSRLLPPERKWKAEALAAQVDFAYDMDAAVEALRVAYEMVEDAGEGTRELANYCDLLAFAGRYDEILDLTEDLPTESPTQEAGVRLRLDRLDALDAQRAAEADRAWDELLRQLDLGDEPTWAGIAWQRRGASFAYSGDVDRSHDAYRRAMAAFSAVPGYEEQAADGLYSLQLASLMNGESAPEMDLRALAYEQRGLPEAPVARAAALSRLAMAHRIGKRFPDALKEYYCALQIHQSAGSVQGYLEVSEKLGELFVSTERPATAMGHYIAAGKSKEAGGAAALAPPSDVAAQLRSDGARWERAATLAVLAEVGPLMPESFLSEIGSWVLAEADTTDDLRRPPHPPHNARLALPKILLGLPDALRELAVKQVSTSLVSPHVDLRWGAEVGLEQATRLELADAGDALVESFVGDPHNSRVSLDFVAERVKLDPKAREQVRAVALDQSPALAAMSIAGQIKGDDELEEVVERAAQTIAEAVNVERSEREVRIGIGRNFATEAIAATNAREEARHKAISRLLEIAADAEDSENNRHSAATALFNLAEVIPPADRLAVLSGLAPLARGDYPLSRWDENIDDPLSRMRISMHTQAALWSAALGTMGRILAENPTLPRDDFLTALDVTIQRGPDLAIAAAIEALAHATDVDLPVPLETLLVHADQGVRFAALGCWAEREAGLPPQEIVEALVADSSLPIRHRLTLLAADRGEVELLARMAENDQHAMIRRVAKKRLGEAPREHDVSGDDPAQ